jgi:protein-S-isoprenylcysteine O-methyltransferase Ste14
VRAFEGFYNFDGAASLWYVGGPVGLATLAVLWLLYAAVDYLCTGRKMKISQYRGRELLKTTAMAAVIAFGLLGAGQLALLIFHREVAVEALVSFAANVLVCISMRRLYKEEEAMVYRQVKNEVQVPVDSYDIRFRHK